MTEEGAPGFEVPRDTIFLVTGKFITLEANKLPCLTLSSRKDLVYSLWQY